MKLLAWSMFCITLNYFYFENKLYILNERLSVGCPISLLLVNIFVDSLENKILSSDRSNHILFWYRYVDNISACFHDFDELIYYLSFIINNSIYFLDLTITKINNELNFQYTENQHTNRHSNNK